MPLTKQLIEIALASGLSQKSDLRSADLHEAATFTNCVRLKNGAIRKRFGHTQLGARMNLVSGSVYNAGNLRGRPWAVDGRLIYAWSDQSGIWESMNFAPEVACLDRVGVGASPQNIIDYDAVVCNGLLITVFLLPAAAVANPTIWYSVHDVSGGSTPNTSNPVGAPLLAMKDATSLFGAANITAPRLAACGTTVVLTCMVAQAIRAASLDTTAPYNGFTGPTTLVTTAGAAVAGVYDLAPVVGDTTKFAIAYESNVGALSAFISICNVSGLTVSLTKSWETQANYNTFKSISLCAQSNSHYWMQYIPTAGASIAAGLWQVRVGFYDQSGNTIGTQATIFTTASSAVPVGKSTVCPIAFTTSAVCVWATGYAAGTAAMNAAYVQYAQVSDTAGAVVLSFGPWYTPGVQLASKAVNNPAVLISGPNPTYFAVQTPSKLQGTTYLACGDYTTSTPGTRSGAIRPVATFAPRLSKSTLQPMAAGGSFTLPSFALMPGFLSGVVYALSTTYSTSTFHNACAVQLVDFLPTYARSTGQLGEELLMGAGVPALWCGANMVEAGFTTYPELATPTASGAGGNLSAGTYQYIATYGWYDTRGQIHRSATSPAVAVTTVNNDTVTVVVPFPPLTWKQSYNYSSGGSDVNYAVIELYRTTANGTLFYRHTADPAPAGNRADTSASTNTLSIIDTMSDAALTAPATAQLLYTTGGVLDNFNPPTSRLAITHQNRFFLAGCDEPTQVWPSKALTSGEVPGFNEVQNFNATGAVRALASLDDKLIMFVQRGAAPGIEYVTGQGPTDTGTQSDWSPPIQVMTDATAIDQRGTCTGPFGVLFRSTVGGPNGTGGIFLLSRDLGVRYVSGPVEDSLAAQPVVTSMLLHPNAGRVYITIVPTDYGFTTGTRLVWDYLNGGVWSTDRVFDADQANIAGARTAFVANTATQGLAYHWVTSAGRVYRETNGVGANSYTDAGSYVQMTFKSALLRPAMAGFARFWKVILQSDSLDASDLTMVLQFDNLTPYSETSLWTAAAQAAFLGFPRVNVMMTPGNQKAEGLQVTLIDAAPTGGPASTTGQGPSWATITLEVGVKEGAYRNIPPAQRA